MKQNLAEAKILLKVHTEKECSYSSLSNKKIVESLCANMILTKNQVIGKRGFKVKKGRHFDSYVNSTYNGNLEEFIAASSRAELQANTGDDKAKNINPQKGMYIYTSDTVNIGLKAPVLPMEEDTSFFIHDSKTLTLDKDIVIIGLENFESLMKAKKLKVYLGINTPSIFIYRNPSFLNFLKKTTNQVYYFPDFDLPGIEIFEHQILKSNPDAKLIIPDNIESMIDRYGNRSKYLQHRTGKYSNFKALTNDGKKVADLVTKYQKNLPQEIFHSQSILLN